jgi:hypothetical protein
MPALDTLVPKLLCSNTEAHKMIRGEFKDLPISKQRKYQLRMQRDGWCVICGELAVGAFFCLKHFVMRREAARRRVGARKRLKGPRSYKRQAEAKTHQRRRPYPKQKAQR